jgi:hypothetical protein
LRITTKVNLGITVFINDLNQDVNVRAKNDFKKSSVFRRSVYILLPTPDELVIYPVLNLFFAYAFHLPIVYGVLLLMILYRGLGSLCMLGALVIGDRQIYHKLKEKLNISRTADKKN